MMTEFQNTIDLLGDEETLNAIINNTITEFNDDIVTRVANRAFYKCTNLELVNLPNCVEIHAKAFSYCQSLRSICFPSLEIIGDKPFEWCTSLIEADFPKLKTFDTGIFERCGELRIVKFGAAEKFNNYTFGSNSALGAAKKLDTLVLRTNKVVVLGGTNVFKYTPFASDGTGGTVYVHAALITEYQNDTNWSTLYAAGTCNFVAIEGSEYE